MVATMRWMSVGPRSGGRRHRQGTPTAGRGRSQRPRPAPCRRLLLRPPPHVRSLEGQELGGASPGHGPSRDAGVERCRDRGSEHVGAVGLVRHPKCQAQVGVGPQVVLDDAGGALGGEDQVEPEGAAPLGDVDHPHPRTRAPPGPRRRTVDDDHQAGRRLGVTGALQLEQVLGPLAVEDPLAVPQLGGEGAQRASHQVRAQVGDQPDRMGQPHALAEGGAPLVIDQEEGDCSGAWADAMPRIHDCRSSLLPEPVVPPTRAWGPWLRRSRTSGPVADWPSSALRLPARRPPPLCA